MTIAITLFYGVIWIAGVALRQQTAPALVLVGFHMMGVAREIVWDDVEEALPAFVTAVVMPFTWSITNGIGAGFVTYGAIRLLGGRARGVPPLLWVVCAAFLAYFVLR